MALRSREVDVGGNGEIADMDLARRASEGDGEAFEELYRRHVAAAWRVAQAVASTPEDAADAVSEAFTRILQALGAGRLRPDVPFVPYLLTTTRNAAIDQHRYRARVAPDPEATAGEPPSVHAGPGERAVDSLDSVLVAEAFRSLPERWRSVLWLTEVEGLPARDVGDRMGLSPNGTAQLAHRARSGLRERYLQSHLRHGSSPGCARTVNQLGSYVAGALSPRAAAQVDQHLAGCAECRRRAAELEDIGSTLRGVALPIPVGLGALTFTRWRSVFATAGHTRHGVAGFAGAAASERVTRSLAITTAVLLALGVITAGLMSGGNGPRTLPGSGAGGAVAVPPTAVVRLAQSGGGGIAATGGAPAPSPLVTTASADGRTSAVAAAPSPPAPPTGGNSGSGGGTTGGPSPGALAEIALGANLSVGTASAAAGTACTGVSINGSPSCAPPAPSSPGLSASVTSPLGQITVPTSSKATTTTSTTLAPAVTAAGASASL